MLVDPLRFLMQNLLIVVVVLLLASLGWVGWMAGVGVSTKCCSPRPSNAHSWISGFLKKPDFVIFGIPAGEVWENMGNALSVQRCCGKS